MVDEQGHVSLLFETGHKSVSDFIVEMLIGMVVGSQRRRCSRSTHRQST
jgi:hypothetical protein